MKIATFAIICLIVCAGWPSLAQGVADDALSGNLNGLYRLSNTKTYSISPENITGASGKGGMAETGTGSSAARDLGKGWKISPSVVIGAGKTLTLAEIGGSGAVQHIWMTSTGNWRFSIIRIYWDGEKDPSVEVPLGDFFAMGWGKYAQISSLAVCVNPGSGFNSYWPMPFRKNVKITMENLDEQPVTLFYQIDFARSKVPKDAAYFHAQFRRANPQPYKQVYTIVDNISGKGQYVGTYLAWGVRSQGWWGQGEIKFYLDGDKQFPTINGTGTEDYFGGSYKFEDRDKGQLEEFTTPYSGLVQAIKIDRPLSSQQRFGMYRWHIVDPIRFDTRLSVTIQDLGSDTDEKYVPLMDDISSVAFWYQTEPHAAFPRLPSKDQLGVN